MKNKLLLVGILSGLLSVVYNQSVAESSQSAPKIDQANSAKCWMLRLPATRNSLPRLTVTLTTHGRTASAFMTLPGHAASYTVEG